ncbi:ATP-binding protein [Sphingomonas oligophenolica]|uniref:histidine kinase n=1 Tax=Sphingomonas oligophenolica TaxID=301154 RepID=A0ABU9YCT9_9SPHN
MLAVMLAGVLAVQLVTFALLQFAPLPRPPVFSVAQVATVLRTGRASKDEFRLHLPSVPAATGAGRAAALAASLARELGVAPARIRLTLDDPPFFREGPRGHRPDQNGMQNANRLLVGDFTASFQRPNGQWLTAQPVRSGMGAWRTRLLLFLLAALVTVTPFAWLLARWVTRPVALFADAAERIGRDPHTAPLIVGGPAEIAHAARAMNEMQQRLNRYVDDRTVMVGAIAHDLRTPLMRLSLRLERAPEAIRQAVERDILDMQAMITAATDYVRGAIQTGNRRRLDLRALAESAVDDLADLGQKVALLPGERVVIEGDPVSLRAALDNLLTNAVHYGGDAEVSLTRAGGLAVIEVRDHGPGMSDEEIERAFEPFSRGEQSRNRETGGIGLGLASVRAVIRLHGGEASLRNHAEGGLLVRIALPL